MESSHSFEKKLLKNLIKYFYDSYGIHTTIILSKKQNHFVVFINRVYMDEEASIELKNSIRSAFLSSGIVKTKTYPEAKLSFSAYYNNHISYFNKLIQI